MPETKYAVVTGASSGIGYAITKQLAAHGYTVYACARRTDPIQPLAADFPDRVLPTKLDITDLAAILAFKDALHAALPDAKLHLLYNNAGQSCTLPALDVSDDAVQQCFRVNVFAHINITRELAPLLINARGTIVFTGSLAGLFAFPFGSVYSATKAAIHQYARGLHLEMRPFGVRVINAITGGVATNIADTRPLPPGSVYDFPAGRAAFAARQTMARDNAPISADAYAAELMRDIASAADPVDVWHGSKVWLGRYLMQWVPYWLLEYALNRKFHLLPVIAALRAKAKRE